MTRAELKKQALGRLRLSLRPADLARAGQIADEVLMPYLKRDETEHDGKKVVAFNFGPHSVMWLERKIRERLKL